MIRTLDLGMHTPNSDGIEVSTYEGFVSIASTNFQSEGTWAKLDAADAGKLRDWLNDWLNESRPELTGPPQRPPAGPVNYYRTHGTPIPPDALDTDLDVLNGCTIGESREAEQ